MVAVSATGGNPDAPRAFGLDALIAQLAALARAPQVETPREAQPARLCRILVWFDYFYEKTPTKAHLLRPSLHPLLTSKASTAARFPFRAPAPRVAGAGCAAGKSDSDNGGPG